MAALVLGIINIAIVVGVLILVGLLVRWFGSWIGLAIPDTVTKCYLAIVFLIGLYMIVSILFGLPSIGLVRMTH